LRGDKANSNRFFEICGLLAKGKRIALLPDASGRHLSRQGPEYSVKTFPSPSKQPYWAWRLDSFRSTKPKRKSFLDTLAQMG